MLNIIHLSDLHTHKDPNKNKLLKDRLQYISNEIIQPYSILVLSGDITDDAEKEQQAQFKKIIKETNLDQRTLIVMGNHDFCKAGNQLDIITTSEEAVARFQLIQYKLLSNLTFNFDIKITIYKLEPFTTKTKFLWWNINKDSKVYKTMFTVELPTEKVLFILLDSNHTTAHGINFARGQIGPKQLKLLKQLLNNKKYSNWCKIAILHHHCIYNNYFLLMEDADEFLKIIWNTLDIHLAGHKHQWDLRSNDKGHKWGGYMAFAGSIQDYTGNSFTSFTINEGRIIEYENHDFPKDLRTNITI